MSKAKTKEKEYVSSVLPTYGDSELLFISWVKKINPKGKVQKRLLALSEHHIFSFKFSALGKKALQRYGHYFDLKELISPDKHNLDIQFQDFNIKFSSDDVPKIVKAIREIYVGLHPYHPEQELSLVLKINDKKSLLPLTPPEHTDTFEHFWKVFTTWNGYFNGSNPSYFKADIEELFSEESGLELHNPILRDHVHFKALCKSLLFYSKLTRLSLVNYTLSKEPLIPNNQNNHKEEGGKSKGEGGETDKAPEPLDEKKVWQVIEASLVELISQSYGLRHLSLSGLPLTYNFFKTLSDAVKRKRAASTIVSPRADAISSNDKKDKKNKKDKKEKEAKEEPPQPTPRSTFLPVEILDFSDTKIDERSGVAFADTLKILSKTLAHVNLAGTGIQPETIHLVCEALLFCTGVSLKHLDFSLCTFDKDSTSSLSPVLSAGTCLEYLGLRSCEGLDINELCRALKNKGCGLAQLNISENNIDENNGDQLSSLLASTASLKNLSLSSTSLGLASLAQILKSIGTNKEMSNSFVLNVSENPSLSKKKDELAELLVKPLLLRRSKLHSLNLDGAGLGDDGMQVLFSGLAASESMPSLKELSVSRNLELHKEKKDSRAETAKAISAFLAGNPPLESLTMMGDGAETKKKKISYGFGPLLGEALSSLTGNTNLLKLNITGNDMGDEGVDILATVLSKNTNLKTLHWDANRISLKGYQAFLSGFENNHKLIELAYPVQDIKAIEASLGADKKTKKAKKKELQELLARINATIKRNISLTNGETTLSPTQDNDKGKEKKAEEENNKEEKGKKKGSKKGSRREKKTNAIQEESKNEAKDEKADQENDKNKKEGKTKGKKKGSKRGHKADKLEKRKDDESNKDEKQTSEEKNKKEEHKEGEEKPASPRELKGYYHEEPDASPRKEVPTQYSAFPKLRKNSTENN